MKKLIITLCLSFLLIGCSEVATNPNVNQNDSITRSVPAVISQTKEPKQKDIKEVEGANLNAESNQSTSSSSNVQANDIYENTTTKSNTSNTEKKETIVYITRTGHKYHRNGCRYLSRSQIPISLSNAKSSGYDPCSVCNPPY